MFSVGQRMFGTMRLLITTQHMYLLPSGNDKNTRIGSPYYWLELAMSAMQMPIAPIRPMV